MNGEIAVARCYRCGSDWPIEDMGHPPIAGWNGKDRYWNMSGTGSGVWLQRVIYERGTGRKLNSQWIWIGHCCVMSHSGPDEEDCQPLEFTSKGGPSCIKPIGGFEKLGEETVYVARNGLWESEIEICANPGIGGQTRLLNISLPESDETDDPEGREYIGPVWPDVEGQDQE